MSLISWLQEKLGSKAVSLNVDSTLVDEYMMLAADVHIREMAFWTAVNIISGMLGKCEFKTFMDGKEEKGPEYHLWNLSPNKNQNAFRFKQELLAQLYWHNECLVVEQNGQLLVADSFTREPFALYDDVFKQVAVGNLTFDRSFAQSEVLYFTHSTKDMRRLVGGLYESYYNLIAYSMKNFQKSRGTKGIFEYGTLPTAGTEERKIFDTLINERIKTWLNADNSALPLGQGQSFKELTKPTYSQESTRDIRALIDDVYDFTAKAFCMHPALLRGDVQDTSAAVDYTLTFCLDPLATMLQTETNRKRVTPTAYANGTYVQIDTRRVKHVDLLSLSAPISKLTSSGFTVNQVFELVGMPRINEPWADTAFMTKNNTPITALANSAGGGEKD